MLFYRSNLFRQHTNHTATCYGNTTMQNIGVFVSNIGIVSFVAVYLLLVSFTDFVPLNPNFFLITVDSKYITGSLYL